MRRCKLRPPVALDDRTMRHWCDLVKAIDACGNLDEIDASVILATANAQALIERYKQQLDSDDLVDPTTGKAASFVCSLHKPLRQGDRTSKRTQTNT